MTIVIILIGFVLMVYLYTQQPKFGRLPSGVRLERIKKSPNFKNGAFKNLSHTPDLTEGESYYSVTRNFLFGKKVRMKPDGVVPSIKTDLLSLNKNDNVLIWFGHSSYFIQVDGKRMLVDPVLSGNASPLSFTTKSFPGTDIYTTADLPDIDYLFVTHDHWDHLDYDTVTSLKGRVKKIVCGLGTGEHFDIWGFDKNSIIEMDWNEEIKLDEGVFVWAMPARHFSGRGFSRNKALWTSFVLRTASQKFFLGGDSGYDIHFKEIGALHGPFDLAILENGQYDKAWKYIHMMPDEVIKAAKDLRATRILPVHSAKFVLGNHPWDEPLSKVNQYAIENNVMLITPLIGERVDLNDTAQRFSPWWTSL